MKTEPLAAGAAGRVGNRDAE
jgi:hypothetical protein